MFASAASRSLESEVIPVLLLAAAINSSGIRARIIVVRLPLRSPRSAATDTAPRRLLEVEVETEGLVFSTRLLVVSAADMVSPQLECSTRHGNMCHRRARGGEQRESLTLLKSATELVTLSDTIGIEALFLVCDLFVLAFAGTTVQLSLSRLRGTLHSLRIIGFPSLVSKLADPWVLSRCRRFL
jgi:hypothetical protein